MIRIIFVGVFAVTLGLIGVDQPTAAADSPPPIAQSAAEDPAEPMQQPSCGDGQCQPPEDCNTCPQDCGNCCGNNRCEPPEDCNSCPQDCPC